MLKTRLSTCGTEILFKNRKKIHKNRLKNRKKKKIEAHYFRFRGMLSAHKKFGTIWVKTVGVVPEQTDKQTETVDIYR